MAIAIAAMVLDDRLLFALSVISGVILLVFLLRRGWGAMPRWQRIYVVAGLPIIAAFYLTAVFNLDGYLEADGPIRLGEAFLSVARGLAIWWGLSVCLSQSWMLLGEPN
jgi:hypothetical protein